MFFLEKAILRKCPPLRCLVTLSHLAAPPSLLMESLPPSSSSAPHLLSPSLGLVEQGLAGLLSASLHGQGISHTA